MKKEKEKNKNEKRTRGGQSGNKNAAMLEEKDIRQIAYKDYCNHIAAGKSKRSWFFEHKDLTCTFQTMEKHMQDRFEFDPKHMEVAEAQSFGFWENVVSESAIGINKDANTASLQMIMRNKFGWDKNQDRETVVDGAILQQFDNLMNQLKGAKRPPREEIEDPNTIEIEID